MARYRVAGPDGKVYVFEGPDGAKPEDVEAFAAQQFAAAQDTPARRAAREDMQRMADPTGGFVDNVLSGAGSGITSVLRAVGGGRLARAMGLPDTKAEADKLDAPLMATGWTGGGKAGKLIGSAAPALPLIAVTPATLAGAAAVGAGTGAALTEGGVGDRAVGAVGGALGGAGAHVLPAVFRAGRGLVRGLVDATTENGLDRIAGRALSRFATRPENLDNIVPGPTVTGATPTLAEATRDPGLATLQRAVSTLDPQAAAAIAARLEANNGARMDTLRALAGEDVALPAASRVRRLRQLQQGPTREAAEAARTAGARESYGAAFDAGVDPAAATAMQPQIQQLLSRPSIAAAQGEARRLAAEEGIDLGADMGSVQGLHYLKRALDNTAQRAKVAGDADWSRLVTQTGRDLGSVLDEIAPAYQAARREYAGNSVPINRQDVAARIADRATTAVRDFSGNRTLQAQGVARALNDEAALIGAATGRRAGATALDDLLTPTQSQRIGAVRDELETLAALDKAANGPGSQTAKMLASQNLVRQVAGPVGLPESWLEGVLGQTAMRPLAWAAKSAENKVAGRLADAALDPAQAAELVRRARAFDALTNRPPSQLELLLQRVAPVSLGYGSAQGASQ